MDALSIFRPGRHTAADGTVLDFTEQHLRATVAAYDPAAHEAPLCIGHPQHNAPAYGWVQSLAYAGSLLQAAPRQVDPAFAELVQAGRYKKISASFYLPDSPANPKPGVYYLRHVGFLGAAPPAVKGLPDAQFAADEQGIIEFADWGDVQNAGLWRRLREWIIAKFGLDEADKVISDFAVQALEEAARQPEPDLVVADGQPGSTSIPSYSEQKEPPVADTDLAAREAVLKQRESAIAVQEAEFAERAKALSQAESARRREDIAAFVGRLVQEGRVLPRDEAGLVAFMAGPDAAGIIEFGEGADKRRERADAWLREFLGGCPVQVDYTERAASRLDTQGADASGTVDLAEATLKRTWHSHPELRAEFLEFETYAAYMRAEANGQVRILRGAGSR